MTQSEEVIVVELISKIVENENYFTNERLSFFCAIEGEQSHKELMVIGRSVNGWTKGYSATELKSFQMKQQLVDEMYRFSEIVDNVCPMSWVVDLEGEHPYNTRRSAFWRVIHSVMLGLKIHASSENWSSALIWSNLYKVSPSNGGNPGNRLKTIQLQTCTRLLIEEILQRRPKRLLFLTGWNWAIPFLQNEQVDFQHESSSEFIEALGYTHIYKTSCKIQTVVVPHPQGKTEAIIVREVLSAFGA